MKFYKSSIILSLLGVVLFGVNFVFANNIGLAVDQVAVVFDADSGESQEFAIKVKNISEEEYVVEIDKLNYVLGADNEITLTPEDDVANGLKDWITTTNENVTLSPNEESEVIFDVNVPENAEIGSHRGAVIFRIEQENEGTVKVNGEVGVHVLINVKGETHASGKLNSFDVPLLTTGLVDYEAEFENTGNIHYVPYGEVVVQNIFTKKEEVYKYDKHFVFPGKTVTFSKVEKIPSLFGLYKATAIFVDGEGATRTKIDFVMGYFFPPIFIVIVVFLGIVISKIVKKNKANKPKSKRTPKRQKDKKKKKKKESVETDTDLKQTAKKEIQEKTSSSDDNDVEVSNLNQEEKQSEDDEIEEQKININLK